MKRTTVKWIMNRSTILISNLLYLYRMPSKSEPVKKMKRKVWWISSLIILNCFQLYMGKFCKELYILRHS